MESLNFDIMIKYYDETRIFNQKCFDKAINYIVERFPPNLYKKVFEPGIGTGRIAIPLAQRGYNIFGIDISTEMLNILKKRIDRIKNLNISYKKADATKIPYDNNEFNLAIIVYLFYFIKEWKKAVNEILRVVNGPIILMHTGYGLEIPILNERYKQLSEEIGFSIKNIGVKSTKEVVTYLENLGYQTEWVRDKWQWESCIQLNIAINYLEKRAYSFSTFPPDDIHNKVIKNLKNELKEKYGKLNEII
ncbi:MAG: class I SAM-dependent methyltransferase, partial [Candidatus Hodarchaeota archaeon]